MKKFLKQLKPTKNFKGTGRKLGTGEDEDSVPEPQHSATHVQPNQSRPPPAPVPQTTQHQPSGQGAEREKVLQAVLDRQKPQVKQVKKTMQICSPVEDASKNIAALSSGLSATHVEKGGSSETSASDSNGEMQMNVALLASLENGVDSAALLKRILLNIISHPSESKYRKLRLDNPKISLAIGSVESARGLLEACGFTLIVEGGSEYLILDGKKDIGSVKDGLHHLEKVFPTPRPSRVVSPNSVRNTQLLLPRPTDAEVPDYFFEKMGAEIKAEFLAARKCQEDQKILMTSRQREAILNKNKTTYSSATIRVRMPEGVLLQGVFLGKENLLKIHEWVTDNLRFPHREFELYFPTRQLGTSGTIASENLMPATLLNFRWMDASFMAETIPSVKDDLVQAAKLDWD